MSVECAMLICNLSYFPIVIVRLISEFATSTNLEKINHILQSTSRIQFRIDDKYIEINMGAGCCWMVTGWSSNSLQCISCIDPKLLDPLGDFPAMYGRLGYDRYAEFKIQMAELLKRYV
jgi:hypothetical protein